MQKRREKQACKNKECQRTTVDTVSGEWLEKCVRYCCEKACRAFTAFNDQVDQHENLKREVVEHTHGT